MVRFSCAASRIMFNLCRCHVRRDHHQGGLAAAADDPGSARSAFVRASSPPLLLVIAIGYRQFLRRDTTPMRSSADTAFQGTERSLARGDHGGDRRHRTPSTCVRSRARPAQASIRPSAAPAAASPAGMSAGDADSRRVNAAMLLVAALNMRGRGLPPRSKAPTTPSTTPWGRRSRCFAVRLLASAWRRRR